MDPMTLAMLFQGGSGILSAIMGGRSESENAQNNWNINQINRKDRNRERQEAIIAAERLRKEQRLGATNASGDNTHYEEGRGWVTTPGAHTQELMDYYYNRELPERRSQFMRKADASRSEDDEAQQLLQQFHAIQKQDPSAVESQLFEAATRGGGEATSQAMEAAMRSAMRRGSSNAGEIAAQINKAGATQRGNAALDAKMQAGDYVEDQYNSKRGSASNLYNLFASRAGQDLGLSADPSPDGADALLGQFANQASQGNAALINAIGSEGGRFNPSEPDNGVANAIGGIGASIGGMGERLGARADRKQNNDLLKMFITGNGQMPMEQGGIFNTLASRMNKKNKGF